MTSYCALLRGISPSNPNMRNDRLRAVFTRLGFADVASVISSGNILFRTDASHDAAVLEDRIQAALRENLGIEGAAILRTRAELQALVDRDPFAGLTHGKSTYLTLTFCQHALDPVPEPFPEPDLPEARVLGYDTAARAVLAITDTTAVKTPDLMSWLQRHLGTGITTRTWLTLTRILNKMPKDDESPGTGVR